jgi:protein-S-isoprenylcysteine O-methyltransferase Ste14
MQTDQAEGPMQGYIAVLAVVLLLGMVLVRAWLMRRQAMNAFHFGSTDKTNFLIPPFVLREEEYMRNHYGQQYIDYCNQVRRYL